jgi:hypothetical protein
MKSEKFDIENLPKENIFKVPENYFSELESNIHTQTIYKSSSSVPLRSWSKTKAWVAVAACTTVGILGYLTMMPTQESIGTESLSGVQNQEIVNYLIQENTNQTDIADQFDGNKSIKISDAELLDNLKVTDKDILQSIDFKNIEEEI